MLHILWLILKFILIALGVLLGLLLLAVLLVLFCPVRYRADIKKEESDSLREVKASGSVSWLFHLLLWEGCYEKGIFRHRIRILGVSLETFQKVFRRKQKKEKTETFAEAKSVPETEKQVLKEAETPPQKAERVEKSSSSIPEHVCKQSKWEKLKHILKTPFRLWEKFKNAVRGFLSKIRKMALTIQKLYDKINWWREFVENSRVQEALSLVWEDIKKLLHHILPTKTEGNVIFGCEDPAVTGGVLAALGMSIPFHKNCIQVTPLFEGENHLEGYAKIKGRFYGIVFLKTALEIYLNKNIKYVVNRWKHKEA
jgi:hypothetical protein